MALRPLLPPFVGPILRCGLLIAPLVVALLVVAPRTALGQVEPAAAVTATTLPAAATPAQAASSTTIGVAIGGWTALQRTTRFAVDQAGLRADDAVRWQARTRARIDASGGARLGWKAALAVDLVDGTLLGQPGVGLGDALPGNRYDDLEVQDAWAEVSLGRLVAVRGGAMTSHWGLGLVAHDGGADFRADRAGWFELGRGGDRVLRAQVYGMPWSGGTSALRGLLLSVAADRVIEDDVAEAAADEDAAQLVVAGRFYLQPKAWLGLYAVRREQHHDDGKSLTANVVDFALDVDLRRDDGGGVRLQAEVAGIAGETTLSPSPDHPVHDLRQLGALGRVTWAPGPDGLRAQLDLGYFSGDDNLDDGTLSAFRGDRNLRQGLVLFEQVLAWQTGRARRTASNPLYVGVPAEDLERLASDGAVVNAVTVFPQAGWRAGPVEVYGGLLVALAPRDPVDPFQTRTQGGGYPRNFLGRTPDGPLLGTEIDLGVRATWALPARWRSEIRLALEHGVLFPGGALTGAEADVEPIQATRLVLGLLGR